SMGTHDDEVRVTLRGLRDDQVGGRTADRLQQHRRGFDAVGSHQRGSVGNDGLPPLAQAVDYSRGVRGGTVRVVKNEFVDDVNEINRTSKSLSVLHRSLK